MSYSIEKILSKDFYKEVLEELPKLGSGPDESPFVEYQLLNANKPDPNSTKKISTPQQYSCPGIDKIRDPHTKQLVTILNVVDFSPVQSRPGEALALNPQWGYIRFADTGTVTVLPEEQEKLWFLELTNRNTSNPWRLPTAKKRFYRVDVKKAIKTAQNNFVYRKIAMNLIDPEDPGKMLEMAQNLVDMFPVLYKAVIDLRPGANVFPTLSNIAEKDPVKLILASDEREALARVMVDEAINFRWIYLDGQGQTRKWKWRRANSKEGKEIITDVLDENINPVLILVEFLQTNDQHYSELKSRYFETLK
jgi:hypothetical protein